MFVADPAFFILYTLLRRVEFMDPLLRNVSQSTSKLIIHSFITRYYLVSLFIQASLYILTCTNLRIHQSS